MNIFPLDTVPSIAAKMHNDKHVVKMILETAQMLSTAHHIRGSPYIDKVYKQAYVNHPCTIWVRRTSRNYDWALRLFKALLEEYTHRYGKIHKSSELLEYLSYNPVPKGPFKPFPQAMPDIYKHKDPVIAYRRYYIGEKSYFSKWTKRPIPEWFKNSIEALKC